MGCRRRASGGYHLLSQSIRRMKLRIESKRCQAVICRVDNVGILRILSYWRQRNLKRLAANGNADRVSGVVPLLWMRFGGTPVTLFQSDVYGAAVHSLGINRGSFWSASRIVWFLRETHTCLY